MAPFSGTDQHRSRASFYWDSQAQKTCLLLLIPSDKRLVLLGRKGIEEDERKGMKNGAKRLSTTTATTNNNSSNQTPKTIKSTDVQLLLTGTVTSCAILPVLIAFHMKTDALLCLPHPSFMDTLILLTSLAWCDSLLFGLVGVC